MRGDRPHKEQQPFRYALKNYRSMLIGRARRNCNPTGCTYVISDGSFWKVGFCREGRISGRLQKMQTANSSVLELVGVFSVNVEKQFMLRFYDRIHRGEWFVPSEGMIGFLRDACLVGVDIEEWIESELTRTSPSEGSRWVKGQPST
jgi:hypothetical protein